MACYNVLEKRVVCNALYIVCDVLWMTCDMWHVIIFYSKDLSVSRYTLCVTSYSFVVINFD